MGRLTESLVSLYKEEGIIERLRCADNENEIREKRRRTGVIIAYFEITSLMDALAQLIG